MRQAHSCWKYTVLFLATLLTCFASVTCKAQQPKSATKGPLDVFLALMQQGREAEAAVEGDRVIAQLKRDKNTNDVEFGMLAATVARAHHGAGSFAKAHEVFDSAEVALKRALGKATPSSEDHRVLEWFYYGAVKNNGDALFRSGR